MVTLHSDYAILASRIVVSNLHKQTEATFSTVVEALYTCWNPKTKDASPTLSEELYKVVMENREVLDVAIVNSRDYDFTYFGIKTLERSYLLRIDGKIVERPQHLIMRTAIGIHGGDIPKVLETYSLMSRRFFIHASPTLFNAGTVRPQMSSCFLVAMKEDSMEGIYDTLKTCALISKNAGGIGLHVHNIRSHGSHILGTNGTSSGVVPMLKVFNSTARYADQGGNKRPGAFAIYLEPWHGDIFEFLDIKKNRGNEEMRARDLFPALWIPDYFMKKVEKDEEWCLFSPSDVPGLTEAYDSDFRILYNKYEKEARYQKKVSARKLWSAIVEAQIETGGPFMLYKDACNLKSNQRHLGTIKSSNLCTEIIQYSSPDEVAVCNLASIALPMFIDTDKTSAWIDYKALHDVTKVILKNLDAIIDKNWYPVSEAEKSNKKHRPVAIGVQGFADMLLALRLPFECEETRRLNIYIFETIYHGALEASIELAEEFGPHESYKGSPASEGFLQFDLWDHEPSDLWDWRKLKHSLKKFGLRNSLVTALMPTASTSQILGFNECFEPYSYNVYTRRVLSGDFQIVNPWLLKDLSKLGLWNDSMKNLIIKNKGSVQNIQAIPDVLKELYKTVWEIPQRVIIDLARDRAPFIDQSQSMTLYLKKPTVSKITSMHFHSWGKGLKTGMYYLRTEAAASPTQVTVEEKSTEIPSLARTEVANIRLLDVKLYNEVDIDTGVPKSRFVETNSETKTLNVLRQSDIQGNIGFSREESRIHSSLSIRKSSEGSRSARTSLNSPSSRKRSFGGKYDPWSRANKRHDIGSNQEYPSMGISSSLDKGKTIINQKVLQNSKNNEIPTLSSDTENRPSSSNKVLNGNDNGNSSDAGKELETSKDEIEDGNAFVSDDRDLVEKTSGDESDLQRNPSSSSREPSCDMCSG